MPGSKTRSYEPIEKGGPIGKGSRVEDRVGSESGAVGRTAGVMLGHRFREVDTGCQLDTQGGHDDG